ncbi:hypothetical protein DPMN_125836 [Dreissena polymorpha]|uniref:Uncharacterized protein n=1 Tax=Dreissena polymorpha TaxID=45954 RepID=A0A9D4GY89_DREPO|nr:hypothetical protein DPMN_125836 [Dreissena polymorpha]
MAVLEKENPKYAEVVENCNEALALFGHANNQIVLTRRDFLKPEIRDEYVHLCNHSAPFTSLLFGDEFLKLAERLRTLSK